MLKTIAKEFWRYWKWLCVALMTTAIMLGLLALVFGGFDRTPPAPDAPSACIERGGTWNADTQECQRPA